MKRREFLKSLAALAVAPASTISEVARASAGAIPVIPPYIGYTTYSWKITYGAKILNDSWLTGLICTRNVA